MIRIPDLLAGFARYGTQAAAFSVALGLAAPQVASTARPMLPACIFFFVALTLVRADLEAVRRVLARPWRFVAACLWMTLAPPAIVSLGLALVGRDTLGPDLVLGLAIAGAAPPLLSAPTIAAIIGIEPSMLLAATVVTTLASPAVSPILAEVVAGTAVPLDRSALALRLALLTGGALLAAIVVRSRAGPERLVRWRRRLDGAGVVSFFIFGVAAMDGVTRFSLETPALVGTLLAVAFGLSFAGIALTVLGFRLLEPGDRLVVGYATGSRNMGLLVASLGASVPDRTFLFFALAQIPVYLLPLAMKGAARGLPAARGRALPDTGPRASRRP